MADKNRRRFEWPAIGNDRVIDFLDRSLANGRPAQSYIFCGPSDLGKSTIALAFARNLLAADGHGLDHAISEAGLAAVNSDLHIVAPLPDKKNISIEQARELIRALNMSSFLGSYKIGIIKQAEKLSEEAKHALLKTLEEPKDKVVIILLSDNEASLPKTILSRSQMLYFYPVSQAEIYDYLVVTRGCSRSLAKDIAGLAQGRPLRAAFLLENPDKLSDILESGRLFLSCFGQSLNRRLLVLENLMAKRQMSGREGVESAMSILEEWEAILRDLLLYGLGESDRLAYSALKSEIATAYTSLPADSALATLNAKIKMIARGREYLQAYVGNKAVLEQIMINI